MRDARQEHALSYVRAWRPPDRRGSSGRQHADDVLVLGGIRVVAALDVVGVAAVAALQLVAHLTTVRDLATTSTPVGAEGLAAPVVQRQDGDQSQQNVNPHCFTSFRRYCRYEAWRPRRRTGSNRDPAPGCIWSIIPVELLMYTRLK